MKECTFYKFFVRFRGGMHIWSKSSPDIHWCIVGISGTSLIRNLNELGTEYGGNGISSKFRSMKNIWAGKAWPNMKILWISRLTIWIVCVCLKCITKYEGIFVWRYGAMEICVGKVTVWTVYNEMWIEPRKFTVASSSKYIMKYTSALEASLQSCKISCAILYLSLRIIWRN